nr:hypothetical protein [Nocardia pneumoniae]
MWFVVDVAPFDTEFAEVVDKSRDQTASDALMLDIRGDQRRDGPAVAGVVRWGKVSM